MTMTLNKPEDAPLLDVTRPDATVTGPITAEARAIYARHLLEASRRRGEHIEEARILTAPDVVKGFSDARVALDAWKKTL